MALPNPALSQIPDSYKYGWHDAEQPRTTFEKGISAEVVAEISRIKDEPKWMTDLRLEVPIRLEAQIGHPLRLVLDAADLGDHLGACLLYTSPSPRDS